MSLRLLLLALSIGLTALTRHRRPPALALASTATAATLQGLIGHAGAAGNTQLLVSEALHLLAAGLWLGSLLPLCLSIQALPQMSAVRLCERFTPLGLGCVLVLAGTGLVQAAVLVGDTRALLTSAYGRLALGKIVLFLAAVCLAAWNRLFLTDRLAEEEPRARRHLLISVATETAIGLAIITTAAFLASAMPGADRHAGLILRLAAEMAQMCHAKAVCSVPLFPVPEIML